MKARRTTLPRGVASARSSIDTGRLAAAASRPGIDPRVWVCLAVVVEQVTDPDEGVFVDVKLIPSGDPETVYLGTGYAGGSFGEYSPVREGDTVMVAFPMGDPAYGGVLISRFNDASDPPHADFTGQQRVVRAEPGQNMKLVVSSGAVLQIIVEDGATIQIGDETVQPGAQGALNGEAIDPFTGKPHSLLGNASLTVAVRKGLPL